MFIGKKNLSSFQDYVKNNYGTILVSGDVKEEYFRFVITDTVVVVRPVANNLIEVFCQNKELLKSIKEGYGLMLYEQMKGESND